MKHNSQNSSLPEVVSGPQPVTGHHSVAPPDYEGLQVAATAGTDIYPEKEAYRFAASNETFYSSSLINSSRDSKEVALESRPENGAAPSTSWAQRNKRWVFIAAAAVVVALVVVLAAVLGTQASQRNRSAAQDDSGNKASGSGSTGGGADTSAGASRGALTRERSQSGAWNGTALAALNTFGIGGYNGSVLYQQANGNLNSIMFKLDESSKRLVQPSFRQIVQKAANGTGLATVFFHPPSGADRFHVTYVNDQGTVSDAWLNMMAVGDGWASGNLSAAGFKAPVDSRVAIGSAVSPWYSSKYATNAIGVRVWVGGKDGALHQYTFDGAKKAWSDNDYIIPGSNAYGTTASYTGLLPSKDGAPTTILCNSLINGSMQSFSSSDGDRDNNATFFPTGSWRAPAMSGSNFPAGANASAFLARDTSPSPTLIYPSTDGKIIETSININQQDAQHVLGSTSISADNYGIMSGSDFTAMAYTTKAKENLMVYFFQKNGSDVSWAIFDRSSNTLAGQGSFDIPP